jgi:hypothetical protein
MGPGFYALINRRGLRGRTTIESASRSLVSGNRVKHARGDRIFQGKVFRRVLRKVRGYSESPGSRAEGVKGSRASCNRNPATKGWRDGCRSHDLRTMIGAAIPAYGCDHRYLLMLPNEPPSTLADPGMIARDTLH